MRKSTTNIPTLQNRLENASVYREQFLDQRGLAYLYSQGITSTHFPRCLKYVEVTSLNVIYKGVGIRNVNGGMEFYCSELCSFPFTVSKRGITIVPFVEGHISRICCLFADLLDYLSYLTLIERHGHPRPDGDCIIMGGPSNFMDLLPKISSYHCVYCYLPLTVVGRTMYLTIKQRRKDMTLDYSFLYQGAVSLHSCIQQKT